MTDAIITALTGSTFLIRMNKPERRNAFDLEMRGALAEAIFEARDNPAVRAVVLAGSQGTFCAGGDLRALSETKRTLFEDRDRIRRLHPWFRELINLESPSSRLSMDRPSVPVSTWRWLVTLFSGRPEPGFARCSDASALCRTLAGFSCYPG